MCTAVKVFFAGWLFFNMDLIGSDKSPRLVGMIETGYTFKDLPYGVPGNVSEPQGFKVDTVEQVFKRFDVIRKQFAVDHDLKLEDDQSKIIGLCTIRYCMFLRNSGYASDVYWGYVDQSDKPTTPTKKTQRSVSYPYYFKK